MAHELVEWLSTTSAMLTNADSETKVQNLLNSVVTNSELKGLTLNKKKSDCVVMMVFSKSTVQSSCNITVNGEKINQVEQFSYLGSLVTHEIFTQQTQAPANRNARSKQWQPWWLATKLIKKKRFLRFSFTQRTQRKRLRLNENRASDLRLATRHPEVNYQFTDWYRPIGYVCHANKRKK